MKFNQKRFLISSLFHLRNGINNALQVLNRYDSFPELNETINSLDTELYKAHREVLEGKTERIRNLRDTSRFFASRLNGSNLDFNWEALIKNKYSSWVEKGQRKTDTTNDGGDVEHRVPFLQLIGLLFDVGVVEELPNIRPIRHAGFGVTGFNFTVYDVPPVMQILGEDQYITLELEVYLSQGHISLRGFRCDTEDLALTAQDINYHAQHIQLDTKAIFEDVFMPIYLQYFDPAIEADLGSWREQLLEAYKSSLVDQLILTTKIGKGSTRLVLEFNSREGKDWVSLTSNYPHYHQISNGDYLSWLIAFTAYTNLEVFKSGKVTLLYDEELKSVAIESGDQDEPADPLA